MRTIGEKYNAHNSNTRTTIWALASATANTSQGMTYSRWKDPAKSTGHCIEPLASTTHRDRMLTSIDPADEVGLGDDNNTRLQESASGENE
jgi:hypothetical protein